jgi:tyrosine-protein kinase Etk/Wzc
MNDQPQSSSTSQDNDEIDLLQLLYTILEGKWLILLFMLIATGIAFIYAFGQPSIYKADALLQVESKKAMVPGLEELAGFGGDDTSVSTELELIKSRKIIGQAIDELQLDLIAYPKKFPLFGNIYQRFFSPDETGKLPPVWDKFDAFAFQYAWGNEVIKIDRLMVPDRLLNIPLTLIAKANQSYQLFSNDILLLEGKVGRFAKSKDGLLGLKVDKLTGLSGTKFIVIKQSRLVAIKNLQKRLKVSEKGKKTGIINLVLEGTNKEQIVKILDYIAQTYQKQNLSRSTEEAANALTFLKNQIKPVKEDLDKAEAALNQYRTTNQTADISMETKGILEVVAGIDTELQQLSFKKDELSQKYTVNHPSMQVVISQQRKLLQRKKKTLSKIKKLPKKQQKLFKLESNFKVADAIYHQLLNNIQEFKIAKASKVGNVYIVDKAVVYDKAIKPKKSLILALGALLGLMLGVFVVFLRKALHQTVDNPELLEQVTGLSVYATIPLSKGVSLTRALKNKARKQKTLLANDNITDPAIESLRSLRTSLHFALLEAENNIVMITGPAPNIGKSFISSNFAAVLSAGEKRVLLIDADMRKGYLHNLLNLKMSPGLSGLISDKHSTEDTIHTVSIGNHSMDVITRGQTPPNPSELLMHSNFKELLDKFSDMYDLILIDTPPVHAVTDPTIIAAHCGVTFMVVRHNQHTMKEIEHAVTRLAQTGIETKGFIFNGYIAKKSSYGYGYQSYYGEYKSN